MDVLLTTIGKFILSISCAIVNRCLSSGLSVLVVFASFLGAILASVSYKYTTNREHISLHDSDDRCATEISSLSSSVNETTALIDTTENLEEEIPTKSIENIYDLVNDNDISCRDFINQLKMYGFQINDEIDIE